MLSGACEDGAGGGESMEYVGACFTNAFVYTAPW